MAKKVNLSLTIPQALSLRNMVASSDQLNQGDPMSWPEYRAVLALEKAIEQVRGEFASRLVSHPEPKEQTHVE